jgi:hypothetical protein
MSFSSSAIWVEESIDGAVGGIEDAPACALGESAPVEFAFVFLFGAGAGFLTAGAGAGGSVGASFGVSSRIRGAGAAVCPDAGAANMLIDDSIRLTAMVSAVRDRLKEFCCIWKNLVRDRFLPLLCP